MKPSELLRSLRNFNLFDLTGEFTPEDIKTLLARAHALRELRRALKTFEVEHKHYTDDMFLSGSIELNGEAFSTEAFILEYYQKRHRSLTMSTVRPMLDIATLAAQSKKVTMGKIDKHHQRILKARATFMVEMRTVQVGNSTLYFVGRKQMLIAHNGMNYYHLITLNGILEGAFRGKDTSNYLNALPCTMLYSGGSVRTIVENGVKVQVIVDDSDDMDIRITDELEQSMGQSGDLINEDTWIKLMSNFGHVVPSSKPHYYADVGKFVVNIPKPPEPRTVLF